jgi:hypothetical protein
MAASVLDETSGACRSSEKGVGRRWARRVGGIGSDYGGVKA